MQDRHLRRTPLTFDSISDDQALKLKFDEALDVYSDFMKNRDGGVASISSDEDEGTDDITLTQQGATEEVLSTSRHAIKVKMPAVATQIAMEYTEENKVSVIAEKEREYAEVEKRADFASTAAILPVYKPIQDIEQYETMLEDMTAATSDQDFKDELGAIEQWFRVLSEAERTAAMYALIQPTSQMQQRFFARVLNQMSKKVRFSGGSE